MCRTISLAVFKYRTRPGNVVFLIGDALKNPYWPQRLGINRGFPNALDTVWRIHLWITTQGKELVDEECD